MSVATASEFIEKIYADPSLRNKLTSQLGDIERADLGGDQKVGETMAKVGSEWGYNFDANDIQSAYQSFVQQQMGSADAELSEEELETVAGGKICDNTCGGGSKATA